MDGKRALEFWRIFKPLAEQLGLFEEIQKIYYKHYPVVLINKTFIGGKNMEKKYQAVNWNEPDNNYITSFWEQNLKQFWVTRQSTLVIQ